MARKLGTEELFYVATSAPTTANDKDDAAYSLFGLLKTWDMSIDGEAIIAQDKDAGAFGYALAGNKTATISGTFNREMTGDTGQDRVEDAALATSLSGQTIYFVKTTATSGDDGRHGSGVINNFSISSSDGEVAEGSFTMTLSSTYTRFTES